MAPAKSLKVGRCLAYKLGPLAKMRISPELGEGRRANDFMRCVIVSLEPLALWWQVGSYERQGDTLL
jgi:hypothetical protein